MEPTRFPHTEDDLPPDVVGWVGAHFQADEHACALALLVAAVTHTGERASDRLLRSATLASRGDLESLRYYVGLLAVDWRDVIVAGEYEVVNRQLVRVRDLDNPIPTDNGENCGNRSRS